MRRRSPVDKIWIGLVAAAVAAAVPPIGAAVGFHSRPVGRHSHPAPAPRVELFKWADDWNVQVGQRTGYNIYAYNNQDRKTATVTEIIDTLPAGFSYLAGSTSGDITKDPVVEGRKLIWRGKFKVEPGYTFGFHFEVRASRHPGWYSNVADVVVNKPFTGEGTGQTATILVGIPTELHASAVLLKGTTPRMKFSARLTAGGKPVAGEWIDFSAGVYPASTYCGAPTNADGIAECTGPEELVSSILSLGYNAYYFNYWGIYGPSFDRGDLIE